MDRGPCPENHSLKDAAADLAGITIGVFSIILITIYGRGGELSYVFPVIYGGAIALTTVIGWLFLGEAVDMWRVVGVGTIVAGIAIVAVG